MAILTNEQVAGKVRGAAAERRVTQADLASALSMSEMAMSRRMKGGTPFTPAELWQVAGVLGVPVAAFFPEPVTAVSA